MCFSGFQDNSLNAQCNVLYTLLCNFFFFLKTIWHVYTQRITWTQDLHLYEFLSLILTFSCRGLTFSFLTMILNFYSIIGKFSRPCFILFWIISSQSRSKNIFKNSDNMRHFVAECATFENRIGLFIVQHKFTTFPLVNLDHTKSKTSNSFYAENQFYFSHRMRSLFRQLLANVFPKSI